MKTESVTLVGFLKGTATQRGEAGIVADSAKKMQRLKDNAKDSTEGQAIWDDYIRYGPLLDRIAQGHEPNKLEEELMMRSEYEIQKVKPYEEHDEKTETQVSTFISEGHQNLNQKLEKCKPKTYALKT